jgi:hypothetical protein
MSSYSSLGRDLPQPPQRVVMGSYSALAGPPRYAEMGDDDANATPINPSAPSRGSYSALADSVVIKETPRPSSYAMMAGESTLPLPPPPSGMKRPRDYMEPPPRDYMEPSSYNDAPPPRDYMDPPRPGNRDYNMDPREYNNNNNDGYNMNNDNYNNNMDRTDEFHAPPRPEWEREHRPEYSNNNYEEREDAFGRTRPPMRGGYRSSFRPSSGRGGPPPPSSQRFREDEPTLEERYNDNTARLEDTVETTYSRQPSTTSLGDNKESQNKQTQPSTQYESPDKVPVTPPRTPSPAPLPPSSFTMALMRMIEMNADMEFAHVKLKLLEMEHGRVRARLEALEEKRD